MNKEPGIIKKAGTFIGAVVEHAKTGFAKAPDDVAAKRMSICKSCPHFDEERVACKVCGCYLEFKTTWASEACPIKKWLAYNDGKKSGSFLNAPPPKQTATHTSSCGGCPGH